MTHESAGAADDDLVARWFEAAREGDDVAMTALVRSTQASVWRICRALGSGDDVEDLVQETYIRAMRSMVTYRGDAPVRAWLMSVARHVCADDVRRRTRRRRLIDRLTAQLEEATVDPPDLTTEDLVGRLGHDRREALLLTQQVGLSYEEAAQVLGCPIGTVRSRVARARIDLQAMSRRADAI